MALLLSYIKHSKEIKSIFPKLFNKKPKNKKIFKTNLMQLALIFCESQRRPKQGKKIKEPYP